MNAFIAVIFWAHHSDDEEVFSYRFVLQMGVPIYTSFFELQYVYA
jgi:hypothetical protein